MTSSEFQAHLGRNVTTLCHCWRVSLRDGTVLGFTDHDQALEVDGTEFAPESGFSASEARKSEGLGVDGMDVEGALSSQSWKASAAVSTSPAVARSSAAATPNWAMRVAA
jgi:hypothetical protein